MAQVKIDMTDEQVAEQIEDLIKRINKRPIGEAFILKNQDVVLISVATYEYYKRYINAQV